LKIYEKRTHVQYAVGIYSIFIVTPLIYPHWLFVVMGIPGIVLIYLGTKREDKFLVDKFGEEYTNYIDKVPAINIPLGIIRRIKRKS